MAAEKTYTARDIDALKIAAQRAIQNLEDAFSGSNIDQRYIDDCGKMYDYINGLPAGKQLLEVKAVAEDININAKAQDDTIRKAMDVAKRYNQDVTLNETYTGGKYRYSVKLNASIYIEDMDSKLANIKAMELCEDINNKIGDLRCSVEEVKFSRVVGGEREYDAYKTVDDGAFQPMEGVITETMSVKEFKKRYAGNLLNETMNLKQKKIK